MLFTFLPIGLLLWLCSTAPFADMLIRPLENAYSIPPEPAGDVIILLTGGSYDYVQDMSGIGAPAANTMVRLVTAARLNHRLQLPIILSGGLVPPQQVASSHIVRRFLVDLGVPAEQILVEDRSRDTWENGLYSKQICDQHGFSHPLLVTSAMHMRRAMFVFTEMDLQIVPFPCALTTWKDKKYSWPALLPNAATLQGTAGALHEWTGLASYQLLYSGRDA